MPHTGTPAPLPRRSLCALILRYFTAHSTMVSYRQMKNRPGDFGRLDVSNVTVFAGGSLLTLAYLAEGGKLLS